MVRSGDKSCDVMEAIPSLVRILRCKPPPGQASFGSRALVLGRGWRAEVVCCLSPLGRVAPLEGMRGCGDARWTADGNDDEDRRRRRRAAAVGRLRGSRNVLEQRGSQANLLRARGGPKGRGRGRGRVVAADDLRQLWSTESALELKRRLEKEGV